MLEMFVEIKMGMGEWGVVMQEIDVVQLNVEVLDVVEEVNCYIVSICFYGLICEEKNGLIELFDEFWNMIKLCDGSCGWMLVGIQ